MTELPKLPKLPDIQDVVGFLDADGNFLVYGSRIQRVKVFSRKATQPVPGFRRALFRPNNDGHPEFLAIVDLRTGRPAGAAAMGAHIQYDAPCFVDPYLAMQAFNKRTAELRKMAANGDRECIGCFPTPSQASTTLKSLQLVPYGFVSFIDKQHTQVLKLTPDGVRLFFTLKHGDKPLELDSNAFASDPYWNEFMRGPWNEFMRGPGKQKIDKVKADLATILTPLPPEQQTILLASITQQYVQIRKDFVKFAPGWCTYRDFVPDEYTWKSMVDDLRAGNPKALRRARNLGFELLEPKSAIESLCS